MAERAYFAGITRKKKEKKLGVTFKRKRGRKKVQQVTGCKKIPVIAEVRITAYRAF